MRNTFLNALGTGIACTVWTFVGGLLSMRWPALFAVWVGFAGCTSYFVAGAGKTGFRHSVASNLAGICIGCTIIASSAISDALWFGAVVTGFFSFLIMFLTHFDLLKFGTCTFIGGFSSFATGGNIPMLVIGLLIGNVLGASCDWLGGWIMRRFSEKTRLEAMENQ